MTTNKKKNLNVDDHHSNINLEFCVFIFFYKKTNYFLASILKNIRFII